MSRWPLKALLTHLQLTLIPEENMSNLEESPLDDDSILVEINPHPDGDRLQKVLARAGIGSRRVCEDYIVRRRIRVNGEVAILGRRVHPESDVIEFDRVIVTTRADLVHYLLNKPRGVVTTAHDPQGRQTVLDLLPSDQRIFPVGRLDLDSEGLIVLTNDGDLAQALTHPSLGVEKEYLAELRGIPTRAELRQLREGIELEDGLTAPATVTLTDEHGGNAAISIAIHEGRNRQVRRMCEAIGHPVRRLIRVRIGPIADPALSPGDWRVLTPSEVRSLHGATGNRPAPGIQRR
jgi:23S rRNA pseudouridine2605 synthase